MKALIYAAHGGDYSECSKAAGQVFFSRGLQDSVL